MPLPRGRPSKARMEFLIEIDRFAYGFIFAFGMGATRYVVAG